MAKISTTLFRFFLFTSLMCLCQSGQAAERPNILWIIAEDLSPDLACYGTPVMKTPNIDRLASQGVRYTKVFGTSSVCAVNRSSFSTGMYATSIGAQHMRTLLKKPLPNGVRTITEYFREAGYFVSNGSGRGNLARPLTKPGKIDWNFETKRKPFDGTDWSQGKSGQPFFAQINISETHLPWTPDQRNPIDPAAVLLPPYYPDHPLIRRHMASYLEEAQILDRKVGAILKRLKTEGLAENTIVFFFGDNGRQFARGKGFLYDPGLQVPLIIRWPDGRNAGTTDDRLLSMIDFAPSIMQMAGITLPDNMHGKPLLGNKLPGREFIFATKDRIGAVSDRVRCVRSARYKYLRNFFPDQPYLPIARYSLMEDLSVPPMLLLAKRGELNENQKPFLANTRPPEELYDLQSDPHELHNLAADPARQETLLKLRNQLDTWIEETGDMGRNPESEKSIAAYREWLDKLVAKTLAKRGLDKLDAATMYDYWMKKYQLIEMPQSLAEQKITSPLVFVITGESNSGGSGKNSDATPKELAPRASVQIMNLTSGKFGFENMQLGVNNLRDHFKMSEQQYATRHGFENELANAVEAGVFSGRKQVYLIKTGHGGSRISQWAENNASGYWKKFVERTGAGKRQLPDNPRWVVWFSLGINDAIAKTPIDQWEKEIRAHLNRMKKQLPGAIVIMTQFQSMGYPETNAAIAKIAASEADVYAVDSSGADLIDRNHWSYEGLKTVTKRMVKIAKEVVPTQ